jgi:hypothetical protein
MASSKESAVLGKRAPAEFKNGLLPQSLRHGRIPVGKLRPDEVEQILNLAGGSAPKA